MSWPSAILTLVWLALVTLVLVFAVRALRKRIRPATDKEIARFRRRPYRGRRVYPDWPGPEGEW